MVPARDERGNRAEGNKPPSREGFPRPTILRVFGSVAEVACCWGFGFCLICFPLINIKNWLGAQGSASSCSAQSQPPVSLLGPHWPLESEMARGRRPTCSGDRRSETPSRSPLLSFTSQQHSDGNDLCLPASCLIRSESGCWNILSS